MSLAEVEEAFPEEETRQLRPRLRNTQVGIENLRGEVRVRVRAARVCVCVCVCAGEVVETDGQKRTWQRTWRTGPAGLLRSGVGVAGTEGTEG